RHPGGSQRPPEAAGEAATGCAGDVGAGGGGGVGPAGGQTLDGNGSCPGACFVHSVGTSTSAGCWDRASSSRAATMPRARNRPANTATKPCWATLAITETGCILPTETTCFGSAASSWAWDCCSACWSWFSWV